MTGVPNLPFDAELNLPFCKGGGVPKVATPPACPAQGGVAPGGLGTNVPNWPSLCALAVEFAIPASQQNVRVAKANLKNGRFMFDSFGALPNYTSAAVAVRENAAPIIVPVESELAEVSSAESELFSTR